MNRFTHAIRESLKTRNWYAALYQSLTLPDICGRLESADGKANGARYAAWFEKYMAHHYRHAIGGNPIPHTFLGGSDCYALRCALLHEGSGDITSQRKREVLDKFHFTTVVKAHCNQFHTFLQLDVSTFCEQVCCGTEQWATDFANDHPDKQNRLQELVTISEGPFSMGGFVFE
jgi:hypothetical protein